MGGNATWTSIWYTLSSERRHSAKPVHRSSSEFMAATGNCKDRMRTLTSDGELPRGGRSVADEGHEAEYGGDEHDLALDAISNHGLRRCLRVGRCEY